MDKLVRERKSLEPRLSRISGVVAKLKPEEAEEIDVQSELDALSEVWSSYGVVHRRIIDACSDDETYESAVKHQEVFEENYILVKNRLLKIMKAVKNRDSSTSAQQSTSQDIIKQLAAQQAELLRVMSTNMAAASASTSAAIANRETNQAPLSDLKLPQMNLPIFRGDYLEWQSFSDLFNSMVHHNPSLKDSQKLYFLKTSLDGEAASLISHLKIEDANYQAALDKLKSRYNKPREIANKHIQRFLAQSALTSSSAQGLRMLHDISDEVIRALKAMNREDRDTWLLFILSEKVDPETKQLWCQKIAEMHDDDITLQCFLSFIESRSFALQSAQPIKPKPTLPFKQPLKLPPRGATTYVATHTPFCELCSKPHLLYQCGMFLHMSPNDRLAHVDRLNLCENCLKRHPGESCRAASTAAHASIGQPPQSLISAIEEPAAVDVSNVLLATVAIDVLDHNGRPHVCRAVLDSASQLAPIGNGRVTTPRLELCAAVILARLITNVQAAMATTTFHEIRAFSDSKVVLAWLSGGASRWKTFVANRVAEIVTHVPAINWYHIGTEENPADLISRGSFPEQLQQNSLWWFGPVWNPIEIENEAGTNDDLDSSNLKYIRNRLADLNP
nr:uncharacterized protein LOC115261333 [Aedes albopictus]